MAETISIIVSFADLLPPGTTITGIPIITVTLDTGNDPNPSNILYQGVTITNGNTIEQRFRLGVIGCIYQINFSVTNNAGQVFDKDSYLAILPDDDNAVPSWLPFWQTSGIYPYQLEEQFTASISLPSGRLAQTVAQEGPDGTLAQISLFAGSMIPTGTLYANPHEDMQSVIALIGGSLIPTGTTYANPHEDMQSAIALIGGSLIPSGIQYHNPHEDMQATITLTGGSLV